jgi:hypothetical protein
MDDYRTVTIPGCAQHDGYTSVTARLPWKCIYCGAPRGEPYLSRSWDGSRQLECHSWINPCGHIETYSEVRKWMEAQAPAKGPEPVNAATNFDRWAAGYFSWVEQPPSADEVQIARDAYEAGRRNAMDTKAPA